MKLAQFILENETFSLQHVCAAWQDAVKTGTDLLVTGGFVEARYYQAILDVVAEHGPYFVIAPGIAMPHARPEAGVIQTSFSLVTLREPVKFGHDFDPVDLVITVAAKSKEDLNQGALVDVMELMDDEERVAQLKAAKTKADLGAVLNALA